MNFFNFKLKEGAISEKEIGIPKDFADKIPKDYLEFLKNYVDIEPKNNMDENIYIKIEDTNIATYVLPYSSIEDAEEDFPECYVSVADDGEFEGFVMSLRKEDFGHVYYLSLEMWQELILEIESDEEKISNINRHSFHIANSFTEFTRSLFLVPRKR